MSLNIFVIVGYFFIIAVQLLGALGDKNAMPVTVRPILGPKYMFAKRDKHYPSRSGQTCLAAAVAKFTKPVTNNYLGPSRDSLKLETFKRAP